ncbi:hypothetical protein Ahy_A03g011560 [Arachis hypogaea]|uniref:GRF-type domain-containing protein n=1 Tax=Arachis hypogaea TaxID=3818 RepID=A0A445DR28_ARAHY|nr:hypothetical protein Ahy_A03g011560 [Arachis hypogaea]
MDATGMKRRSASMVEGGNDRCEDFGMKQYDGMCRCSLAVVALRSKMNANPGRWFFRCPLWKDCKYFQWIDELEEQDMVEEEECSWNNKPGYLQVKNSNRRAPGSCLNQCSMRTLTPWCYLFLENN